MTYTPGVTDRSALDIATRTAKGCLDITDWQRIYANALELNGLFAAFWPELTFPFTTVYDPTHATVGVATFFNQLLANIHALVTVSGVTPTGYVAPKTDYVGGPGSESPTYLDVNAWERDLDLLYAFISTAVRARHPRTGVADCGSSATWQNRFRG